MEMEKLAMQQEKAITPEILNEALRGSEAIKDVSAKVCVQHIHVWHIFFSACRVSAFSVDDVFFNLIAVAPPPHAMYFYTAIMLVR